MLAAGLSYREAGPAGGPIALLLHGYPESSHMWEGVMPALAAAGWHAVAPDLAGFGDSPPDPPGTWERRVESLERFRRELGIERCVPVMHDWGGLIGMWWACEHPEAVEALVISSTGFFPDGKWSGMAKALQEPGTGEVLLESLDRDGFARGLRAQCPGMTDEAIGEYWKAYADDERCWSGARTTSSRQWRRPPLRARAAGHGAGGRGGGAPLRLGGRPGGVRRRAYRLPSPCSRLSRSMDEKSI
jgi:pimeloyl-ACP methyl ester carboxylesterase